MSEGHLLLVGGGHAHVAVLADWIRHGAPARTTLVTPYPTLRYSGMVPSWIAGQHGRDDGLVDLVGLAERAGVDLILDRCVAIDGDARSIGTVANGRIDFDIASLDTGGIGRARAILGEDPRLLDVRPIDAFVERLQVWREANANEKRRIAVVGGGAGGVELAFGLRNCAQLQSPPEIVLVTGNDGLLPGFAEGVQRKVGYELARQGVEVVISDATLDGGVLRAAGNPLEPVDLIVAALGSAAPMSKDAIAIATDPEGFVAVDHFQRSTSHPHILAVGDVAARQDRDVPHSGVHAVRAGPVLAANLRTVVAGKEPTESYKPRPASLYLLSVGNGGAIGSYGLVAFEGRWVGALKRWIDKRWIATYARLASGSHQSP